MLLTIEIHVSIISNPRLETRYLAGVEFREGEAFTPEVLQRRTDEIQLLVVDDQKAVVEILRCAHGQPAVLCVERRDVARIEFTRYPTAMIASKL